MPIHQPSSDMKTAQFARFSTKNSKLLCEFLFSNKIIDDQTVNYIFYLFNNENWKRIQNHLRIPLSKHLQPTNDQNRKIKLRTIKFNNLHFISNHKEKLPEYRAEEAGDLVDPEVRVVGDGVGTAAAAGSVVGGSIVGEGAAQGTGLVDLSLVESQG